MTTGRLTNEELRLIAVDAYDQRTDDKARRDMARECIASRKRLDNLAEANHNLTVELKRERARLTRAANQITAAEAIREFLERSPNPSDEAMRNPQSEAGMQFLARFADWIEGGDAVATAFDATMAESEASR